MDNYFVIKERLPSLNDLVAENRRNKYAGAKMKKQIDELIQIYILSARNKGTVKPPATYPIEIYIEWHENNKRRDVDNIQSAKKYILDAMTKSGIIKDDSRRYVSQVHDIIVDDIKNYVVVELHEFDKNTIK